MADVIVCLDIERKPGILSSAVTKLRRFGLTFKRHRMNEDGSDKGVLLVLEAAGTLEDPEGLREALTAIKGVVRVAGMGDESTMPAITLLPSGKAPPPLTSTDAEVVARIARAHPEVMPLYEKYELSIPVAEREIKVRALGRSVGERVARRFIPTKPPTTLPAALRQAVIPALDHIARAQVSGKQIQISISRFTERYLNNMNLTFGEELERCHFLSGFIEGVLSQIPGLPPVVVHERECRAVGDAQCLFELQKA